ncbi:hypothetical protein EDC96DRAFT_55738 [Choanephora cucurbitarum]|nr:hypothetical protein EDC96DRAFT_55738 [Choanephora cucurbitarum]
MRYKAALKEVKPELKHISRKLTAVEDTFWQQLYRKVNMIQNGELRIELLDWCTQLMCKKPVTVQREAIKDKIIRLEEENSNALVDRLKIMSFKLLNSFDTLTPIEKCVLKLSVSNIVNMSKKVYSDQYQKHFPLSLYESLSSLSPPTLTLSYEQQLQTHFAEFKKIIFEESEAMMPMAIAKRGLKDQICYILIYLCNKMAEWEDDDEGKDDDEDEENDDEAECTRERKKRRVEMSSESDMMMVVKFVLDAVFADSNLRWRSGEKTTNSTKRSKIINELASSSSNNNSCSNVMGRRSDLVLTNKHGVDLCLVESKNGSSCYEEIAQDSKSVRCTKSLYAYNSALNHQCLWSMNWNGKVIHKNIMTC